MKMDIDQIMQTIYDIVVCIPEGCVTTYSDVARFAGMPNHARVVGKILRETPQDLAIPCHRVVGSGGWLASKPSDQRKLLEEEAPFLKAGVSIQQCLLGLQLADTVLSSTFRLTKSKDHLPTKGKNDGIRLVITPFSLPYLIFFLLLQFNKRMILSIPKGRGG